MNAADILKYGHQTIVGTVDGLAEPDWHLSGACGIWSVREIIAHLASFEQLLIEILQSLLDENTPTPLLRKYAEEGLAFNDSQVALRQDQTVKQSWEEYEKSCLKTFELISQLPTEKHRQAGLLAWYGQDYDLEDFLVYTYYGHKREHGAQINSFRDILNQQKIADTYA